MKRLMILGLVLLGWVNVSYAQKDSQALDILEAMSAKYKSIPAFSANISYSLVNDTLDIDEEMNGNITVKDNMYHLDMGGQEIFNNGTTIWTYLKDENEVNISEFDPEEDEMTPTKIYNAYQEGYKYSFLGEETQNGSVYQIVDLVPEDKSQSIFKIRMKILKTDKTLSSWLMFSKDGNRVQYVVTEFNPEVKVDDNFFTFDTSKHDGVEVIDLR
ncbi:LolA family protein [Xanthovirga aplysinae]|uniref:LolA family protein n=1 Tax=Xanthovirga aplysinae TaxID=2529853 RepID=UPI0012BD6158|nr:outer membrane lipoprotein carrier protein LolA [Xanthovirga aplysinae]MTI31034.1 outer membrane lipoprotein carrier protein LolA [Xanthovirga aplysinae]